MYSKGSTQACIHDSAHIRTCYGAETAQHIGLGRLLVLAFGCQLEMPQSGVLCEHEVIVILNFPF